MQISLIDETDKVRGFINSIIFENTESGYKVMDVETEEGDLVTIVGIMPDVETGEKIEASGKWRTHSTYGEQLEVESYYRSLPDDMESMERYLSSGIIKGVGETLARRIVEMFKEQTFHVLDAEPERLSLVKGISHQKADPRQDGFCDPAVICQRLTGPPEPGFIRFFFSKPLNNYISYFFSEFFF